MLAMKKSAAKIIIPLCILLIIAGIWLVKNIQKQPAQDMQDDFDSCKKCGRGSVSNRVKR